MKKIAINGTGRIGLCTSRIAGMRDDLEIVSINTSMDIDILIHLLRYDSVHGSFDNIDRIDEQTLAIGKSKEVKITNNRDISTLDFSKFGAECVLECTGSFNSLQQASAHLKGSVKKVIISAPAKQTPTFVFGVNHTEYKNQAVISNSSCTTNCLAPIVKILQDNFGIKNGFMTTIHSYTNDQNLLDTKHKDIRRARAAGLNIIPTSTGATSSLSLIIPELANKIDGVAIRVPTPNVSLLDLNVNLLKKTHPNEVNELFKQAELGINIPKGILYLDTQKLVSSDFIGSSYSAIVAADKTMLIEENLKVLAWYDNEMGYSQRLIDMCSYILN